jgi:hypothetical protein
LPAKLAQCSTESAHEGSRGTLCSIIERAEGFAGGHPAVLCVPKRWIMLPRHYRRVSLAAHRVGFCDERDLCDDWVMLDMRATRREALAAGYHRDDVDAWTMEGCLRGRRAADEL